MAQDCENKVPVSFKSTSITKADKKEYWSEKIFYALRQNVDFRKWGCYSVTGGRP